MKIEVTANLEKRSRFDAIIIPFWQESKSPVAACELAPLKGVVSPILTSGDFKATVGEVRLLYAEAPIEKRVLCLGIGEEQVITKETLRRAMANAVHSLHALQVRSLTILLPAIELLQAEEVAAAMAEGLFLATYRFTKHKTNTTDDQSCCISHVQFVCPDARSIKAVIERSKKISDCVCFARDLVNSNADEVTPEYIAESAKSLCKKKGRLSCKVYDKKWIEKKGMGLFLAVARGSIHEPRFITITYDGNPSSKDLTVLVGKSVTFDTGGLNLKPTGGIEMQRADMAGAAAVLGTMKAIEELSLPINVVGVIAACENAIGPYSYKPGDVYKSYLGKTVEVNNTDAEGRLTLADALAYSVDELKPSRIINLATLTGSCIVALGYEVAALLSNSDLLSQELMRASDQTHERLWRLPLYDEYREKLKSEIADMKNTGGREGGAIIGGAFLKDFVGNTPWAHLDIAGTAFLQEAKGYLPKNGTGFGVRLLVDFLQQLCKNSK